MNISKYGAASVIGLYLAVQLGRELPTLKEKVSSIDSQVSEISEDHENMESVFVSFQKTLRSICLNVAETKEEIQRCNE